MYTVDSNGPANHINQRENSTQTQQDNALSKQTVDNK